MLSDNIRKYRKENNMSQDELAEKLGVSRQSISLWETGQTQPTIDNIIALSKIFKISVDALLDNNVNEPVQQEEVPIKKKRAIHPGIIIAAAAAIVICAVSAVLLLTNRSNDSDNNASLQTGSDTTESHSDTYSSGTTGADVSGSLSETIVPYSTIASTITSETVYPSGITTESGFSETSSVLSTTESVSSPSSAQTAEATTAAVSPKTTKAPVTTTTATSQKTTKAPATTAATVPVKTTKAPVPVTTSVPASTTAATVKTTAAPPATTEPKETGKFDLFAFCKDFAMKKGKLNGDYCAYQQPATRYGGYEDEYFSITYWSTYDKVEFCLHCPLSETMSINFYLNMRGGFNKKYEFVSSKYYRSTGSSLRSVSGTIDPSVFSDNYPLKFDSYEGSTQGENEFIEESRVGICDLIHLLKKFVKAEMDCDFSAFGFKNY